MDTIDLSELSASLGIPEREVESFDGETMTLTTTDGVAYVLLPDDAPDTAGQTGWVLAVKPSPTWLCGRFPVLNHDPPTGALVEADEDAPVSADNTSDVIPKNAADVIAWIGDDADRAQAVRDAGDGRATVVAAVAEVLDAPAPESANTDS